jgi:phage portal protein BeeE
LNSKEQNRLSANFNTNKLLKGDTATRTAYYNSMRQNGVMNSNDIRDLEEMNLIPAEDGGNEYLVNGNMISLKNAAANLPKGLQKGGAQN